MNAPGWWTNADQAELDVRIMDVIDQTTSCPLGSGCAGCKALIAGLVEWRDRRVLQSRAEWERAYANLVLDRAERLAA